MAVKLELALLLFVFDGVESCFVVGGPGDGAYALDFSWEGFAGFEVLDAEGVLAEAGGVNGVGEPAAVVGDVGGAYGEEGEAFGELISVEDDLFRSVRSNRRAALAAKDGVLFSLFGADVVPPVAFAVRGGLVSLLDVAEHLVIKLVA